MRLKKESGEKLEDLAAVAREDLVRQISALWLLWSCVFEAGLHVLSYYCVLFWQPSVVSVNDKVAEEAFLGPALLASIHLLGMLCFYAMSPLLLPSISVRTLGLIHEENSLNLLYASIKQMKEIKAVEEPTKLKEKTKDFLDIPTDVEIEFVLNDVERIFSIGTRNVLFQTLLILVSWVLGWCICLLLFNCRFAEIPACIWLGVYLTSCGFIRTITLVPSRIFRNICMDCEMRAFLKSYLGIILDEEPVQCVKPIPPTTAADLLWRDSNYVQECSRVDRAIYRKPENIEQHFSEEDKNKIFAANSRGTLKKFTITEMLHKTPLIAILEPRKAAHRGIPDDWRAAIKSQWFLHKDHIAAATLGGCITLCAVCVSMIFSSVVFPYDWSESWTAWPVPLVRSAPIGGFFATLLYTYRLIQVLRHDLDALAPQTLLGKCLRLA